MSFFRSAILMASLTLLPTAGFTQVQDKTVFVQDDNPAMLAAFSKARMQLDDFLDKMRHPASGTDHYAVKIGIADQDNGTGYVIVPADQTIGKNAEFFWIVNLKETPDGFTGEVGISRAAHRCTSAKRTLSIGSICKAR